MDKVTPLHVTTVVSCYELRRLQQVERDYYELLDTLKLANENNAKLIELSNSLIDELSRCRRDWHSDLDSEAKR